MRHQILGLSGIALCVALMGGKAPAATVGLWLFDEMPDTTPAPTPEDEDPLGGELLFDESVNALNFQASTNSGTVSLSSDRPAVIATGTSLDSQLGGARGFSTPSSSLLHRGSSGEQTIEFWFKYTRPSTAYVLSFNGGNGGANSGDWGIYGSASGALNFFDYSSGFPEVSTGALSAGWHHIAFTTDLTGNMSSYVDGVLAGQSLGARPAVAALADVLKFGRSAGDGFGDHDFLIDELRISDVALLPGTGTGNGELAWNASLSLVPEPGTGLLAVAGISLLARRRHAK